MAREKAIGKAWAAFVMLLVAMMLLGVNAKAETAKTAVLVDESYSSRYFSYEPFVTEYLKDTSAEVIRFGDNGKTAIYDEVQRAVESGYSRLYVISDCWNTSGRENVENNNVEITLLTPYFQSEDVERHLDNFVSHLGTTAHVEISYWNEWPEVEVVGAEQKQTTSPKEEKVSVTVSSPEQKTTGTSGKSEEANNQLASDAEIVPILLVLTFLCIALASAGRKKEDKPLSANEVEKAKKTATIINTAVQEDKEVARDLYILGDCSGSMERFQKEVMRRIESAECSKYMFADKIAEYPLKDPTYQLNRGGTDIVRAINHVLGVASKDAHIVLVTDLLNNRETNFSKKRCAPFSGVITIVYYPRKVPGCKRYAQSFIERMETAMPNATIEVVGR